MNARKARRLAELIKAPPRGWRQKAVAWRNRQAELAAQAAFAGGSLLRPRDQVAP